MEQSFHAVHLLLRYTLPTGDRRRAKRKRGKNMKKKILAVLLVLCAVVLFALTASAATDTSVGYRVNVTLSADSYFCGTGGTPAK